MPLASADVLKQHAEAAADHRDSPAFAELSALMCWSAVIRCARNAGAISSFRAERLERLDWKEDFADFVSPSDTLVRHADDMRQVPVGAFIAFIRVDPPDAWHRFLHVRKGKRHIVHAMLSLGKGWAAGNKNSSVGIGHDVGWEKLNLAEHLNWVGGERYDAINGYPRNVRARLPLRIRYRKLEAFQIEDQGRRDGSTKVQTLATDKTAVVKPGERWQVGPLADCVAVAAIKRTDNLRAGQRAGRVFIWHVNGGRVDRDLSPYKALEAFLGDAPADWVFVHGSGTKAGTQGRKSWREQGALGAVVAQTGRISFTTGQVIKSYSGSDLWIDSDGVVLNLDRLIAVEDLTGRLIDANGRYLNDDGTPVVNDEDSSVWDRLLPK